MKVDLEKPGTPHELVHFGTKGMKWGVRRTQGTHQFKKDFPTAGARANEIRRARASVRKDQTKMETATNPAKRKAATKVYLKNPDRATALRITRGEKVVLGILYAATPTVVVPAAVAGFTAVRVGRRRALEK